jgi:hypothetical protein
MSQSMSNVSSKSSIPLTLKPDERHLFIGKTRSGKTFLARYLLEKMYQAGWPITIVDSPDHFWYGKDGEPPKKGEGTILAPRLVEKFQDRFRCQIYQPPTSQGWDDPVLLQYMTDCFEHGHRVVYFDELFGVVDEHHIPSIFQQLWAQGRKIDLSAWCCTQQPVRIPDMVKSQAENIYCFQIFNSKHRELMATYLNNPQVKDLILPERYFWYRGFDMPVAKLCKPIEVK